MPVWVSIVIAISAPVSGAVENGSDSAVKDWNRLPAQCAEIGGPCQHPEYAHTLMSSVLSETLIGVNELEA